MLTTTDDTGLTNVRRTTNQFGSNKRNDTELHHYFSLLYVQMLNRFKWDFECVWKREGVMRWRGGKGITTGSFVFPIHTHTIRRM